MESPIQIKNIIYHDLDHQFLHKWECVIYAKFRRKEIKQT